MDKIQTLRYVEKVLKNAIQKAEPKKSDPEKEKKIWQFFLDNPPPYEDVSINGLAESIGLPPDEVEEIIYNWIGSLINGGKSKGIRPGILTDDVLQAGMKVEAEHSDNPMIQSKIVYDHVTELGNLYYERLKEMEDKLNAENQG